MSYEHLFPTLPDDARIWINVADRLLDASEQSSFTDTLDEFLNDWTSHGRPVKGAAAVVDGRMLILAGVIPDGDISGCGIDKSVRLIDETARRLGVAWSPALFVIYRDERDQWQTVSRSTFRSLAEQGTVHAGTLVLDPSITTLEQLRKGLLAKPAGECWHARAFTLQQPV